MTERRFPTLPLIDESEMDAFRDKNPRGTQTPMNPRNRCLITALTHADVMITTLIWYMQDRMDEVLSPTAHASLITLAEHCETLPAFHAAALSDFEMMPRS